MGNCLAIALNERLTEGKGLGTQVVNVFNCYSSDDDYKCWRQDFFFFKTEFDYFLKETDRPRALIS